jgi:hypothetical protein
MSKSSRQSDVNNQDMVISYLSTRKAVGYLGVFFPPGLALGAWLIGHCPCVRDSVSSYYYTDMVTYFAGTLCAVALFLFTYKGYDFMDQVISNAGAIFALCIAFFPADETSFCSVCNVIARHPHPFINTVHNLSAGLFFLTMAYMTLFLFTKTDPHQPSTKQKEKRNKVYKTCGYVMLISMLLIPCLKIKGIPAVFAEYSAQFWLEAIVLMAFGFSWLVKGETLLKDK